MSYRTPNIGALTQLLLRAVGVGTPNGANPIQVAQLGSQAAQSFLPNLARALPAGNPAGAFVANYDPSLSYEGIARQNGAPAFGQNAAAAFDTLQQGAFLAALSPGFKAPEINYTSPAPRGTIQTSSRPAVQGEYADVIRDPDTGRPLSLFRIEDASGVGPIQPSMSEAYGKPLGNTSRYYAVGPEYVKGFARGHPGANFRVIEAQASAKPSEVADIRYPSEGAPIYGKMLSAVQEEVASLRAAGKLKHGPLAANVDWLVKAFGDGKLTPVEFMRNIQAQIPESMGAIRSRMGAKLTIQHANEGSSPQHGAEAIVNDPSSLRVLNTYTPQEFLQTFGGGTPR